MKPPKEVWVRVSDLTGWTSKVLPEQPSFTEQTLSITWHRYELAKPPATKKRKTKRGKK